MINENKTITNWLWRYYCEKKPFTIRAREEQCHKYFEFGCLFNISLTSSNIFLLSIIPKFYFLSRLVRFLHCPLIILSIVTNTWYCFQKLLDKNKGRISPLLRTNERRVFIPFLSCYCFLFVSYTTQVPK